MLQKYDCNYISVDWSELAGSVVYPFVAQTNVPIAGKHVGYDSQHVNF